jgi:DNA-binding beta-propeller fold protein YncE
VPLPGVKGDFDHLEADVKGNRLFLAAEDHHSVEVFDLKTGKHLRSVTGIDSPHQIVFEPDTNKAFVTDSGPEDGNKGYIRVISGTTYKITESIPVLAAADSAGYDPDTHLMYADTGGQEAKQDQTTIAVIDAKNLKKTTEIKVDSPRVEAIRFEHSGSRMFANLRTKAQVGVFDKNDYKILATWEAGCQDNVPMAFDEANHRLFIVCRKPATFVVLDSESGNKITSMPTVDRADDMAYDSANKRIYVAGGDGFVAVYSQKDPDHYEQMAKIATGPVGKTAVFVPELNRYYVATVAKGTVPAKLMIFDVK